MVIDLIGAYGPALAAIFVSGLVDPERSDVRSVKRWALFMLVFLTVDLIWVFSAEKFGPFDAGNLVLFAAKLAMAGPANTRKRVVEMLMN